MAFLVKFYGIIVFKIKTSLSLTLIFGNSGFNFTPSTSYPYSIQPSFTYFLVMISVPSLHLLTSSYCITTFMNKFPFLPLFSITESPPFPSSIIYSYPSIVNSTLPVPSVSPLPKQLVHLILTSQPQPWQVPQVFIQLVKRPSGLVPRPSQE